MADGMRVSWRDLVFALSETMDLASPELRQHQLRTAYTAWRLGQAAGHGRERLERLFAAAAFHDIGALTPEEKLRLHAFECSGAAAHCVLGAHLFQRLPRLRDSARVVLLHHTPWTELDGELLEPDILDSQLLQLADYLERAIHRGGYILHQEARLREAVVGERGRRFHPEVVDLFLEVAGATAFWLDLASPDLTGLLRRRAPLAEAFLDFPEALLCTELFSLIIDFRSSFTSAHSAGVTACALALGAELGLAPSTLESLHLAGNLHDIGKLVVPAAILEKAGCLTEAEAQLMRQHTWRTYQLLDAVAGFERVKEIAAFHHERIDGAGYPFRIPGAELDLPCRLLAVADAFTALAEHRPYRAAMSPAASADTLRAMAAGGHFDSGLVELALADDGALRQAMTTAQAPWEAAYHCLPA
jgi:HD-GYP domain-containing protein (c-di-GMP phosphodiesterase class II)